MTEQPNPLAVALHTADKLIVIELAHTIQHHVIGGSARRARRPPGPALTMGSASLCVPRTNGGRYESSSQCPPRLIPWWAGVLLQFAQLSPARWEHGNVWLVPCFCPALGMLILAGAYGAVH
jgi:hypothetical protein